MSKKNLMKNPAVPKAFGTRYLIVRSYYFHIRSLTPQQAARNALAIRFNSKAIRQEGRSYGIELPTPLSCAVS